LHSAGLERHGAEIAQLRMTSARIVEALDVVEDIGTGLIAGAVDLARRPLGLQRREEVDLSRICAAPRARLGHFPFEGDRAFPAQC
jgi:hypothetical protein